MLAKPLSETFPTQTNKGMMLLLLGLLVAIVLAVRSIPTQEELDRSIPCNERKKPHKWHWVTINEQDRLQCSECFYIFGNPDQ